jgi:tetratricopeptide (TPR) repeat protein
MPKKLILHCFLLMLCLAVLARETDPPAIRAKKELLPSLQDTARVNCLNRIATLYIFSAIVHSDSGLIYAREAFNEAQKINYKQGLCTAANLNGQVLLQLSRPNEGIQYFRLTARLARELDNKRMMAVATRGIGQALWYQGNFQQSIDTINQAIDDFRQLGATWQIVEATVVISSIYDNQGNYEKAFEVSREALKLSQETADTANMILSYAQLGKLYRSIGDYPTAAGYYKKGYSCLPPEGFWSYRHLAHCMGDLYMDLHQPDSAYYYYRQSFSGNAKSKFSMMKMGQFYLATNHYDSARYYFMELYHDLERGGEGHITMYAILGLAKIYLHEKNYSQAIHYGNEALQIARQKSAKLNIRDACQLLSAIYEQLNQPAKAFDYYKDYVQMKDSVLTDQFKGQLYEFRRIAEDEKQLAQINILEKEKFISNQKLKANQLLRNILLGGLFLLAFLSLIVFGNISLKRKNEKLQSERIQTDLQRRATDLEMQALRAQMNPHFIFNCLSSINRFILKNEPDKASDYLTRFSRLIRLVLINSQKPLIVLEEEVEMLRLYLEMEQLRFKHAFDYSITYNNDIEPANMMLPPLLLQPFCENAIWHGLMHKEGRGHLTVAFTTRNNILNCTITDNGVGRAKAGELKSKSAEKIKSMGLRLTADRLALFNEDRSVQTFYNINDIIDDNGNIAGTRVTLEIRYKEFIEEPV